MPAHRRWIAGRIRGADGLIVRCYTGPSERCPPEANTRRHLHPDPGPRDTPNDPSKRVRGPHLGWRCRMSIIAWIILGAIAGYLAGFLVKGDEGLGVIG